MKSYIEVSCSAHSAQDCFGILIFFWFHMNSRVVFSSFVRNPVGVGRIPTLILVFPIQEEEVSFLFLMSS